MGSKSTRSKKQAASDRGEGRSRTFTGCRTCRARHLKCDEARPSCGACRRLNISCEGYSPRLLWIHAGDSTFADQAQDNRGNSYRYPLFTERVRKSMSSDLVQSFRGQSPGKSLLELDSVSVPAEVHHAIGPFSVFRAFEDPTTPEELSNSSGADEPTLPAFAGSDLPNYSSLSNNDQGEDDDDVEEIQQGSWQTKHQPFMLGFDLTSTEFSDLPPTSMVTSTAVTDAWMQPWVTSNDCHGILSDGFDLQLSPPRTPRGSLLLSFSPRSMSNIQNMDLEASDNNFPNSSDNNTSNAELDFGSTQLGDGSLSTPCTLPMHAATLLRYLKSAVFKASPSGTEPRVSPWKLLLLPSALQTFAEISLWNTASHTRLSILYTLLAKSAFHLHGSQNADVAQSNKWLLVARDHQQDAHKHLRQALDTEFGGQNQAEYTDLLMAVLGVIFGSEYANGVQTMKQLLLEAEQLIRLRGLPSNKSFNLRVLHHMYTHLRVISESTQITHPAKANFSQCSIPTPGANSVTALTSFHIPECNLGDLDTRRDKPDDVGYNDIHLDVSGQWPFTLYPEMYGIPESLMTLLSQTVSLANEKPKLELSATMNPSISTALGQHTRTLEQQIWSWNPQDAKVPAGPLRPRSLPTPQTSPLDKIEARALMLAMHQALIIYFYRRVYNMSAMIVQDQVTKTLDFIAPCMEMANLDHDYAISIGWTVFMAICEAVTPDLQRRGLACMDFIDESGITIDECKPSMVVKWVWEERSQSGNMTTSWPDFMIHSSA